jgi:hypothetical protein
MKLINFLMKDLIMKHQNLFQILQRDKYEICISCKKLTNVLKSNPIINRKFYIETSGQLCQACFESIYNKK